MWRSLQINKQNIRYGSATAVLIACPHKSDYNGYYFFHPMKLVRRGNHSNAVQIRYTEDFVFYLRKCVFRNGRQITDEIQLAYDELEEVFSVMHSNISAPHFVNDYETHKPEELQAEAIEADASLIDYDEPASGV